MRRLFCLSSALLALSCSPESEDPAVPDETGEARPAEPADIRQIDTANGAETGPGYGGEAEAVTWGYTGEIGPEHWGALDPAWSTCQSGEVQSPIDLGPDGPQGEDAPVVNWTEPEALTLVDNGHTIQVDVTGGGEITLAGTDYRLVQYHFHAGSEHTIEGARFPLEVHFVHQSAAGDLAVIGVLFEEGGVNPELETLWENLPARGGSRALGAGIETGDFLPEDLTAWRYAGSLTTPPCSEGVAWSVLETPISASASQFDAFTARYDGNYRPVQPLHGREPVTVELRRGE